MKKSKKRGEGSEAGDEADTGGSRAIPLFFRDGFLMGVTFLLVMTGWIIFRADHLKEAVDYICLMFTSAPTAGLMGKTALCYAALMMIAEWSCRNKETPFDFKGNGLIRYRAARWTIYAAVFIFTLIFAGSSEQFIYFQF